LWNSIVPGNHHLNFSIKKQLPVKTNSPKNHSPIAKIAHSFVDFDLRLPRELILMLLFVGRLVLTEDFTI
jgi:hypothetical protein